MQLCRFFHIFPDGRLARRGWNQNFGLIVAGISFAGQKQLGGGRETLALALYTASRPGKVVDSQDHVLGRVHDGLTVGWVQKVSGREHKRPALGLCCVGKWHVDGHLVSIEVGVKSFADKRVQLNGFTFHKHRLKRLYTETVQGRRTVEHDRVLFYYLIQDGEDLRRLGFYEHFGLLNVVDDVLFDEFLHDERLKKLERHLRGKAALPHLEFWSNDND